MEKLPPAELATVVEHANVLAAARPLTPAELGPLLDQFITATDPDEVQRLNDEVTKGLYGRR